MGPQAGARYLDLIKVTMPLGAAGALTDEACRDIIAYLLKTNGHPAGPQELRADSSVVINSASLQAFKPYRAPERRLRGHSLCRRAAPVVGRGVYNDSVHRPIRRFRTSNR